MSVCTRKHNFKNIRFLVCAKNISQNKMTSFQKSSPEILNFLLLLPKQCKRFIAILMQTSGTIRPKIVNVSRLEVSKPILLMIASVFQQTMISKFLAQITYVWKCEETPSNPQDEVFHSAIHNLRQKGYSVVIFPDYFDFLACLLSGLLKHVHNACFRICKLMSKHLRNLSIVVCAK